MQHSIPAAFTNVITVSHPAKTIYVGEQNSNNAKGEVVEKVT